MAASRCKCAHRSSRVGGAEHHQVGHFQSFSAQGPSHLKGWQHQAPAQGAHHSSRSGGAEYQQVGPVQSVSARGPTHLKGWQHQAQAHGAPCSSRGGGAEHQHVGAIPALSAQVLHPHYQFAYALHRHLQLPCVQWAQQAWQLLLPIHFQ